MTTGSPRAALAVAFLLAALVVFAPARSGTRIDARAAVQRFLEEGPTHGVWRHETLRGTVDVVLTPHPDAPRCVLIGVWHADTASCCGLKPVPRERVVQHFVPGPAGLFLRNHRQQASAEETIDGRPVLRLTWVPRHDTGGETARWFWVDLDPRRPQVVRYEDRSIDDGVVRALSRLTLTVGDLPIPPVDAPAMRECQGRVLGDETRPPPSLTDTAAELAFPLLAPVRMPPGFELTTARVLGPGVGDAEGLALLVYSDGLTQVRLLEGTSEAMDAFEERQLARDGERRDDATCPTLPGSLPSITSGGLQIRRRKDRCRTVLRVDDLEGVSVTLIGCNELSQDAYIEVIESLAEVRPERSGPR